MAIDEIKRKNLIRLCGEHHCETPTKLASVLGVTRQHASHLLKNGSIGNDTIKRLCKAWHIDHDEFIKAPEKVQPVPTSQGNDLVLSVIAGRLNDLADRIKAQGNALQGLQDDCLKVKNDIQEIYKRMADAADTKDVRRLKKVG